MTGRASGRRAAWAAVVVGLLTAGCASVPSDGPVQRAEAGAAAQQTSDVRVLPASPRPGAPPDGIVRGFLAAGAAFENDHAIARKYLTEAARGRWEPGKRILVHSQPYEPPRPPEGDDLEPEDDSARIVVATTPTAVVDSLGTYQEGQIGQQTLDFGLVKERGEWRIDALPDGVLLATSDLERTFRLRDVFFLDRDRGIVVSDVVLMPNRREMADALVRRLLDGPSGHVDPAVNTAVPDGMTLAAPVTVDARGLASVELDGRAPASTKSREGLSAQIVWTLRQLPEVQYVRIRLRGQPLEAGSAPHVVLRDSWPGFDPDVLAGEVDAFAVRADRVGRLADDGRHTPLANDAGDGDLVLQELAVDIDGNELAGVQVKTNRVYVGPLDASRAFRLVAGLPQGRWVEPSYDRLGSLWVTEVDSGAVYAVDTSEGGSVYQLPLPPLDGKLIRLRVARDGIRFAAVTAASRGRSKLHIGAIARATTGRPRVVSLRTVKTMQATGDLAWVDHRRVALLPSQPGRTPLVVDIAGFDEDKLPLLSQGSSITAAPDPASPLLVGTTSGILRLDGRTWEPPVEGRAPAYPG